MTMDDPAFSDRMAELIFATTQHAAKITDREERADSLVGAAALLIKAAIKDIGPNEAMAMLAISLRQVAG